HVIHVFPEIGK
ncbi:hypothetical protein AALP_AAs60791U000100, partial [Arabis alpina]